MSPRAIDPSWRDLRLGATVSGIGLLALFGVVFLGSDRGPLRPDTYTLYVHLDDAGGLRVGSPVEVRGALAGSVVDVTILPPGTPGAPGAPPASERGDIRIELSVEEGFRDHITASSRAQLATLGMGGERYVKIVEGDVREPSLEAGAVVPTVASVDLDLVLAQAGRAGNEIQEIAYLGTELQQKIASGAGTAGKLLDVDGPLYDRVYRFEDIAQSFLEALDHGEGVIPGWRSDGRLEANVAGIRSDVAFLSDSSRALEEWSDPAELRRAIGDLREAAAALSARLDSGQGTLGRLVHDQELFVQIRVLQLGLGDLIAALQEDPMGSVNIELF
jgi:phospholipid/cholesterol/gamma-HCH transport system substrate-binding protein